MYAYLWTVLRSWTCGSETLDQMMTGGRADTDNTVQLTVALAPSSAHWRTALNIAGPAD